jgi:hypothetical protein
LTYWEAFAYTAVRRRARRLRRCDAGCTPVTIHGNLERKGAAAHDFSHRLTGLTDGLK